MRQFISVLIICSTIVSCNKDKPSNSEVVYVDDLSQLDSGALVRIVDKDGKVIRDDFASRMNNTWMAKDGLNGDIFYDFEIDSSGNKIKTRAFKYDYRSEYFSVDINNDTLYLGDHFVGYISFKMENGNEAIIDTKNSQVIIKEGTSQDRLSGYQVYEHRIVTKSIGAKDFKGKIIIDGEEYPFEYKYVVLGTGRNLSAAEPRPTD